MHPVDGSISDFVMADWGSNAGYFSIKLAQFFAGSTVLAVEGEAYQEYNKARKMHEKRAREAGVWGKTLSCNTKISGEEFRAIAKRGQFDVQLTLSVFHWLSISDHEHFLEMLGWNLAAARTTFLELPEARVYGENTGQSFANKLNSWYGGVVSEETLVKMACDKVLQSRCKVRNLGIMFHDTGTVRTILRVDVAESDGAKRLTEEFLKKELKCK